MLLALVLLFAQTSSGSSTELFERKCIEAIEGGRRQDALRACMHAMPASGFDARIAALHANALLMTEEGPPTDAELSLAVDLAAKALEAEPRDVGIAQTLCAAAQAAKNVEQLRACVARLENIAPQDEETRAFAAELAKVVPEETPVNPATPVETVADTEPEIAELEDPPRLTAAQIAEFEDRINRPRPREGGGFWGWVWRGFLLWAGSLVVLLAVGWVLSMLTMRSARAATTATGDAVVGGDLFIRRAYRFVLWLACLYYWVSLPLMLVVVLAGGGMMLRWIGLASVRGALAVGFVTVVSAGSLIIGLITRPKWSEPGLRLDPNKHPRLKEVLREVAVRVGTRPVTAVYLTPDTDIAVTEPPTRTGVGKHRERWLILGTGALQKFPLRSFKAVLAHEYGHFANEDTAAGGFAISVLASLRATTIALAETGGARWFNPAWIFLRVFTRVFLRISHGATRLQEILADRVAATAYGSKAFEDGLSLAIQRGVSFNEEVNVAISRTVKAGDPLDNVYELLSYEPTTYQRGVAKDSMTRPLDAYDSHPPAAQRIEWVRKLAATGAAPASDDTREAWDLFDGKLDLERKMTERLRARLALAGIAIKGVEHTPTYVVEGG